MSRMLGAPAGGSTPFGKSGFESLTVRPIFPLKGASGFGNGSPFDGVPSVESLAPIAVSSCSPPQNVTLQGVRIPLHRIKVQLDGPGGERRREPYNGHARERSGHVSRSTRTRTARALIRAAP